mmetsp:Transcript_30715/g.99932  ORF Transcript_30715/g.99932 Transcript_30715/m.99932 type:complete len:213 (-) Transcript_30715:157-795(-)
MHPLNLTSVAPRPPSPRAVGEMKTIFVEKSIAIPEGVEVEVKSRHVKVTGPRGKLEKSFKHIACDVYLQDGNVCVELWDSTSKKIAVLRTVISHVRNMFNGVCTGYTYKMRMVYAHFPINVAIEGGGKKVEIRNFLGEKRVRKVDLLEGVTILRSTDVKDELVLSGNDVENVSASCLLIAQSCSVLRKDLRKFLDGIYVSEKGVTGSLKSKV